MTETTYNGWTNYETWAVALWLDNEQTSYCYWRDQMRRHRKAALTCLQVAAGIWTAEEAAKNNLADQLKEEVAEAAPLKEPSVFSDLLWAALDEVNWHEIAGNWLSEEFDAQPPEPVVYGYSRAQAIADGVLVEASPTAAEAGLKYPTALTAAVWTQCVKLPEQAAGQDERGRLWDLLWILKTAIQQAGHTDTLGFTVLVNNDLRGPRPVRLKALCGPGDDGEPVITVMLPDED